MKRNGNDISARAALFDAAVGDGLGRKEVREAVGLLALLSRGSETAAACARVRARLLVTATRAVVPQGLGVPTWLRVAAAIALLVTGLAVLRGVPAEQPIQWQEPVVLFAGEAVMDSQFARLEADFDSVANASFWGDGTPWFEGSE